jgi:hypothetical protein
MVLVNRKTLGAASGSPLRTHHNDGLSSSASYSSSANNKESMGAMSLAVGTICLALMAIMYVLYAEFLVPTPFVIPEGLDLSDTCQLWMAESVAVPGTLGYFIGKDLARGDTVTQPDLVLPLMEINKNEWSPWHDFSLKSEITEQMKLETHFMSDMFAPGLEAMTISSVSPCNDAYVNVEPDHNMLIDSAGVHRSTDPTAGAFTYRHNFGYSTKHAMAAGEEVIVACDREVAGSLNPTVGTANLNIPVERLQEQGVCVDNLAVATSTIPGIGRGAFAKRAVLEGDVITPSPIVHFDRSQMEIVDQSVGQSPMPPTAARAHQVFFKDTVIHQQLMLNYCFGHPNSTVVFIPIAPGVNFINHDRKKVNAYIDWSTEVAGDENYFSTDPNLLVNLPARRSLIIDIVAMRNIQPGEEIFLDYGDSWVDAWEKHVAEWTPAPDVEYKDAATYSSLHQDEPIKTEQEQAAAPYPTNLQTVCYYMATESLNGKTQVDFTVANRNCLRPCKVTERSLNVVTGEPEYIATVFPIRNNMVNPFCQHIPFEGIPVHKLPALMVKLADAAYTTDAHMRTSFRHEIGVDDDLYPDLWMKPTAEANSADSGEVMADDVEPWKMAPMRWKETGKIVTHNAFRLGLDKKVTPIIHKFAVKAGIEDFFKKITIDGNALVAGYATDIELAKDVGHWFIYRPNKDWTSNLHWLFTHDETSQNAYLKALSDAGFDNILKAIGEKMGFKKLNAMHLAFIGVSHSAKGFKHADVVNTGNKTFNVIIPMKLASETGPELEFSDMSDPENVKTGKYKYEYDVAQMIGDSAIHATAGADYRPNKEFRYAASIYVMEVDEVSIDGLLSSYISKCHIFVCSCCCGMCCGCAGLDSLSNLFEHVSFFLPFVSHRPLPRKGRRRLASVAPPLVS